MVGFRFRPNLGYIAILIWTAMFLVVGIVFCSLAHAECLPSLKAARQAHPTGHIRWNHGCFYVGRRPGKHEIAVAHAAVPLPHPRPSPLPVTAVVRSLVSERVEDIVPRNSFEDRWRAVYGLPNTLRQQLEARP